MKHFVWIVLLMAAALPCRADYFWLSNDGLRLPQDSLAYPFSTGDTIQGAVHCNGPLALSGHPVFYGQVSISAPAFIQGPVFDPEFRGPPPIYNAPQVGIPAQLDGIRQCAATQGGFYVEPGKSWRVSLHGSSMIIYKWDTGTPFDSTEVIPRPIVSRMCLFFDGPLEIYGHMNGQLTIASSHSINLLDNVVYDDAVINPPRNFRVPMASLNMLGIASEADIKISNTPANGRGNSRGEGFEQTNADSTSILVSAALLAVGGFTFEQQNDPDSGYVCDCVPDERGTLYLFGTLTQGHCGHLRRSTNDTTGYLQQLIYDGRSSRFSPPCWPVSINDRLSTDTLDFGGVPVGHTVWDTAHIYVGTPCNLGSVIASYPFYAERIPPFYSDSFAVPVSFTPPRTGQFDGILYVYTLYRPFQIVLRGRGLRGEPAPVSIDISPNPFNLTTSLRYSLSEASAIKITLYDILGRTAKVIDLGAVEPGEHSVQLTASDLASGVYFVRLQAGTQMVMKKVMLIK